jgi:eukaryotic-like serine/threonine-protein kinase
MLMDLMKRWLSNLDVLFSRRNPRWERRTAESILAAITFFLLLGIWLHFHVREGLQDTLRANFTAVLDAEVFALQLWESNEKEMVRSWLNHPQFTRNITRFMGGLGSGNAAPGQDAGRSESYTALKEGLEQESQTASYQGYAIVDRSGLILLSDESSIEGGYLSPKGVSLATRAVQEGLLLTPPVRVDEIYGENKPSWQSPMMLLVAPAADDRNRIVGVLFFSFFPGEDFSRIFSMSPMGAAGDSYAFNSEGLMISESRLSAGEMSPFLIDKTRSSTILNVRLVEAGRSPDTTAGTKGSASRSAFTRMAGSALLGESGMDLDGYRNHRGVEVVGAWRWLDEQGYGIAIEVEKSQAYSILSPIRAAVIVLFSLLAVSTAFLLLFLSRIGRLRRRISEIERVGSYKLEEKIGEGGTGTVYTATHALLKRQAAIKFLKPEGVPHGSTVRFEREVRLTSRLTHPNTIVIYDYGRTQEGIFYYVMEYLNGFTLARLLERSGAVAPARSINILAQISGSLIEAHSIGLIHRDIKPLNVMLCAIGGLYDHVKVLDFGMVKDLSGKDPSLTATQALYGTPCYIAPERIENPMNCDARTDIYSLGAIAFNLVTGRDVFEGTSAADMLVKAIHEAPSRPSSVAPCAIPGELEELILRCLAKDPGQRPQSVAEIRETLEHLQAEHSWTQKQAREWWRWHADELRPGAGNAGVLPGKMSQESKTHKR